MPRRSRKNTNNERERHEQHKQNHLSVKMEKVTSSDMLNFRALHVNKAKFGSFCAAFLSLFFSPYFCPVLQCNNEAYFARSLALIW